MLAVIVVLSLRTRLVIEEALQIFLLVTIECIVNFHIHRILAPVDFIIKNRISIAIKIFLQFGVIVQNHRL